MYETQNTPQLSRMYRDGLRWTNGVTFFYDIYRNRTMQLKITNYKDHGFYFVEDKHYKIRSFSTTIYNYETIAYVCQSEVDQNSKHNGQSIPYPVLDMSISALTSHFQRCKEGHVIKSILACEEGISCTLENATFCQLKEKIIPRYALIVTA